jgi:hypothetical protein
LRRWQKASRDEDYLGSVPDIIFHRGVPRIFAFSEQSLLAPFPS